MKKIITAAALLVFVAACKDDINLTGTVSRSNHHSKSTVPVALLNPAGESWKVSPVETSCYTTMDKESNKAGKEEAALLNVKFEANEHYRFIYQLKDDATVQVEGKVLFKYKQGKNIFVLQPLKGTKTTSGRQTILTSRELMDNYSTQYLWETISFDELPRENFLLLVNLDAHPMAGAAKTGSIERSWVVKFYSR